MPLFETEHDGEKFFISNWVVALRWVKFLREVRKGVEDRFSIRSWELLGQNAGGHGVGSVSFKDSGEFRVEMTQNQGGTEGFFQVVEYLLMFRGPGKFGVLLE